MPNEWNIRDAYVARPDGTRVIDFRASNLHVVSYSVPVRERMSLAELRPHLHTLPDRPDWIPYRTSYYAETWGFCLSQRALDALPEDDYEVCIDSTLAPGHLSYGELSCRARIRRRSSSRPTSAIRRWPTTTCRRSPSPTALARDLASRPPSLHLPVPLRAGHDRHDRLARAEPRGRAAHPGGPDVDLPRRRLAVHVQADGRRRRPRSIGPRRSSLRDAGADHGEIDFYPFGYDERQYNSPGFRAPVGSLMRGRHGRFPEYHTSADSLEFVSRRRTSPNRSRPWQAIVDVLEGNRTYTQPRARRRAAARQARASTGRSAAPTSPTSTSRCCGS